MDRPMEMGRWLFDGWIGMDRIGMAAMAFQEDFGRIVFFFNPKVLLPEAVVFFLNGRSGLVFRSGSSMICNRCFPISTKYLFTFHVFSH